jgi:UDP-GlcNAc3NAcA epimerase
MYDAVLHYRQRAMRPPISEPYILCTLHRAETTDDPDRLRAMIGSLADAPHRVMMPLHPRTRKLAESHGIVPGKNVCWLEPVSYFAMLGYIEHSAFVVTDSGGVQKEAYYLGKRCITTRDETEWTELTACGANRLVGSKPAALREAFSWAAMPFDGSHDVYGRGDASERIAKMLASELAVIRALRHTS